MRRLIAFLVICGGLVVAQQKTGTFKVTVICPDKGGLAPTTATYTISAQNIQAASGKALAQFKQENAAHRSHKQGFYEIQVIQ